MKFIRYGSLVPQYHELDDDEGERWFHTAPVEYGFYAFPKGYVEPFLLGGVGSGSLQNGRRKKLKDSDGRPFIGLIADFKEEVKKPSEWTPGVEYTVWDWKQEWKDYFKKHKIKERDVTLWPEKSRDTEEAEAAEGAMPDRLKYFIVVQNPPIIFEYTGNIWSHIDMYYVRRGDFTSSESKEKTIIKDCDILKKSGSWVLTDIKTYKKALETYVRWMKYDGSKGNHFSNRGNSPIGNISKDEFEVFIESIQIKKR